VPRSLVDRRKDTSGGQRALRYVAEGAIILIVLALVIVAGRWVVAGIPEAPPASEVTASVATPAPPRATADIAQVITPALPSTLTPSPTWTCTPTSGPVPTSTRLPTLHPPDVSPVFATAPVSTPLPLPIPAPMPVLEQPDGVINIILLGADQSADRFSGRTDVMIVASVDPDLPSVSLLSIPRDFYAWVPSYGFEKLTAVYRKGAAGDYPGGGPELLKATIEYNLGIRIHYYALVDFDGFIKIVDALGGVDVAVECPLSDTFPDPDSPTGQTDVDWLPGIQHLDGKHALWYARSRMGVPQTSDFDRNRRQQQVLRGLYRQALALDILPKIPQLWDAMHDMVSTDLGLEELVYLASIGSELDMTNVKSAFLGTGAVQQWTAPNGAWVLVPYYEALGPLVEEALSPPAAARAAQPAFRVEVWNAAPEDGLGYVAAERLRWEGFEVVDVQRIAGGYARTQIWDLTTTSKGSPLPHLMHLYGRYASDVVYQPTEDRTADFRVILGDDYDPCLAARSPWRPEPLPTPTPLPTVVPMPTP
jgi:LCP family protein required for cell wall assembly